MVSLLAPKLKPNIKPYLHKSQPLLDKLRPLHSPLNVNMNTAIMVLGLSKKNVMLIINPVVEYFPNIEELSQPPLKKDKLNHTTDLYVLLLSLT